MDINAAAQKERYVKENYTIIRASISLDKRFLI